MIRFEKFFEICRSTTVYTWKLLALSGVLLACMFFCCFLVFAFIGFGIYSIYLILFMGTLHYITLPGIYHIYDVRNRSFPPIPKNGRQGGKDSTHLPMIDYPVLDTMFVLSVSSLCYAFSPSDLLHLVFSSTIYIALHPIPPFSLLFYVSSFLHFSILFVVLPLMHHSYAI